jgi:arylsulfatase A-like enzyme
VLTGRPLQSDRMKALVLVLRGLRPAFVGCYGNEWPATPALDRLAAEGVVFDRHMADQPDMLGARQSWRSGLYHFPHAGKLDAGPPADVDLMRALREQRVTTTLILDGSRPGVPAFSDGWERVQTTAAKRGATALERTLEATVKTMDKLARRKRWLLWVELATLLPPWDLPDDFRDKYFDEDAPDEADEELPGALEPILDPPNGFLSPPEDETCQGLLRTYAGAVAYLDAGLEMLFEELRERRLLEDLLVVVTGDHGLPLGEHGVIGDFRPWLYNERSHLPLMIRLPGGAEAGRRIPALTQSVDLMPTLLDAFGMPLPPVHGHSLLPLVHGAVERVRGYACAGLRLGEGIDWALWTPEWSLLVPVQPIPGDPPRGPQLFVQPDDRWQINDLRQHNLELAEGLEQTLRGFVTATAGPGPLALPSLPGACW